MNPGLGTSAARDRQVALQLMAGTSPPRRRRRGTGPIARRVGITLIQVGWRLMGSDESGNRTVAALRRTLA